jgi:hypothetical protein
MLRATSPPPFQLGLELRQSSALAFAGIRATNMPSADRRASPHRAFDRSQGRNLTFGVATLPKHERPEPPIGKGMSRKSTESRAGKMQCLPEMHLLSAGAGDIGVNSEEGEARKIPQRRIGGKTANGRVSRANIVG